MISTSKPDSQVFCCGKTTAGELGFEIPSSYLQNCKSTVEKSKIQKSKFFKKISQCQLEKGITHFIPIFSLRPFMINKVFAGGLHSFALAYPEKFI